MIAAPGIARELRLVAYGDARRATVRYPSSGSGLSSAMRSLSLRILPPQGGKGSHGCWRRDAPRPLRHPLHHRLRRRLCHAGAARAVRRQRRAVGGAAVRLGRVRGVAGHGRPSAWSPRRCISAIRSGRGAPSRNGARRGCRARACWRCSPSCRPASIAIGWLFLGELWAWCGLARAASARCDGVRTAMIYASLKPIRAWHNLWTLPGYLAMGLATGALWFTLWAELMPRCRSRRLHLAAIGLGAAAVLKRAYWRFLDSDPHAATARKRHRPRAHRQGADADRAAHAGELPAEGDGLPHRPQACAEAAPHRAHRRLRAAARCRAWHVRRGPTSSTSRCSRSRRAERASALVTERWLFFAEAKHTVTLYYGAERLEQVQAFGLDPDVVHVGRDAHHLA